MTVRKRLRCKSPAPKCVPAPIGTARKRLRCKTPAPKDVQALIAELPNFAAEEDSSARKKIYLLTFPHPVAATSQDGVVLKTPGSFTKQQLLHAILDSCSKPDYQNAKAAGTDQVSLEKATVFSELHAPSGSQVGQVHFHVAVSAASKFYFLPIKRSLLQLHGLASHWSCTHDGYWSAVRYGFKPSPKKPEAALDKDPLSWSSSGSHPPLHECCYEPMTAAAIKRNREFIEKKAAEQGKKDPRATDLDLYSLVVEKGFRNIGDHANAHKQLIVYVREHCSKAMWEHCWKQRERLPRMIDDVWLWEEMKETLDLERSSRIDILTAAGKAPCTCAGKWTAACTSALRANDICIRDLCKDVFHLLQNGRAPTSPVLVLAGAAGGEGKSLFLKPLLSIYGQDNVFETPVAGSFPLLNVLNSKICFFDDWRFKCDVLPWNVQCLLYDGSNVPVNRPQNVQGQTGHTKYSGSSPIFATTKLGDIEALSRQAQVDLATGMPGNGDAAMIHRRLKVYAFTKRLPKPVCTFEYCGRCFAQLVLQQAGS